MNLFLGDKTMKTFFRYSILAIALFGTWGCPKEKTVLAAPASVKAGAAGGSASNPAYYATLSWQPVAPPSGCGTGCQVSYNVYRGTAAGAESTTPANGNTIGCSGTTCTYQDASAPLGTTTYPSGQSFFFKVESVEIIGNLTIKSAAMSPEASVTFPSAPAAPAAPNVAAFSN